jgi:hypothetical protein
MKFSTMSMKKRNWFAAQNQKFNSKALIVDYSIITLFANANWQSESRITRLNAVK